MLNLSLALKRLFLSCPVPQWPSACLGACCFLAPHRPCHRLSQIIGTLRAKDVDGKISACKISASLICVCSCLRRAFTKSPCSRSAHRPMCPDPGPCPRSWSATRNIWTARGTCDRRSTRAPVTLAQNPLAMSALHPCDVTVAAALGTEARVSVQTCSSTVSDGRRGATCHPPAIQVHATSTRLPLAAASGTPGGLSQSWSSNLMSSPCSPGQPCSVHFCALY